MSDAAAPQTPSEAPPPRPATARRGPPLAGVAIGLAILAIGVGGLLLLKGDPSPSRAPTAETAARPPAERPAEAPPPSRERQTAVRLLAGWHSEASDPLAPTDLAAERFEPMQQPPPPFDAVDSTLIDTRDTRIRLAHARAVPRDEICRDASGQRFSCGLLARVALQNHIAGKTLLCRRLFLGDPSRTGIVEARCSVDGEDLALRQIRGGWATPSPLAEPAHVAAFEEARRARRGVWAGSWEIPARDPAEADARAVGFGTLRIGGVGAAPAAEPPR